MFVNEGARIELLKAERGRFLDKEWPKIIATIDRLGLDAADLLQQETKNDTGVDND
jgi:GntR family transcriptional regulator